MIGKAILKNVDSSRCHYEESQSSDKTLQNPDTKISNGETNKIRSRWNPIETNGKVKEEIYYPSTQTSDPSPDAVFPLSVRLDGQSETPAQILYKKMFPFKRVQYRLAMKHEEALPLVLANPTHPDAILFNRASKHLESMRQEAIKADATKSKKFIFGPPLLASELDFAITPEAYKQAGLSAKELAAEEAAQFMHWLTCAV